MELKHFSYPQNPNYEFDYIEHTLKEGEKVSNVCLNYNGLGFAFSEYYQFLRSRFERVNEKSMYGKWAVGEVVNCPIITEQEMIDCGL